MKKIRILFEGLSENTGGIENWVYNLYKYIDKEKYEICFLIDKNLHIAYQDIYEKDGCKIFKVENRKRNYLKYLKNLKQIYKNNNFDIIHINMMGYSIFERITYACKYSKAKVIVHCHTNGYPKNCSYKKTMFLDKVGRIFVKKYNNKINKIACTENAGKFAFKDEKFYTILNGIDVDAFQFSEEKREQMRKKLNIDKNTMVWGVVAMFNNPKNHTFLIDVFKEYLDINKNAKLVLVGDGYLKHQIEMKVNDLNIGKHVLFLGKRDDVNEILSAIDLYIMPSLYEGLSLSLCEAQANGLTCITSTNVDIKSNITGNVHFINLNKSAKQWAKFINEIIINNLDEDNFYRDINVNEKIPSEFKYKNVYNNVLKLYDKILKEDN